MKAAVYTGTRNLYKDMIPSMKSLLIHSDVEKIYFLIEDDIFPYELPPEVECINVSNQQWFNSNGPNMNHQWTYMVLIRAAFPKIFSQLDQILSLDCDTIITENISQLWDYNLNNCYIAACREPLKSTPNKTYVNMGVAMWNLNYWRENHMDDVVINLLNTKFYPFAEQDCINEVCQGHIKELSADYNINNYTAGANHRKITHFAAIKNWQNFPIVNKYREATIKRNVADKFGLDIIIPTYNDIQGLIRTLKSIKFSNQIQVTVINDCSTVDYTEVLRQFPLINFLTLKQNSGPGIARQYGIEHTSNPYIIFIDSGDYFLSERVFDEILSALRENTVFYLYSWPWLNEEKSLFSRKNSELLHGRVYKREFLELYNITFCPNSSYANEDIGFNRACFAIIKQLQKYENTTLDYYFELPIYMYTYDKNSLTHKENKSFMYNKQVKGLAANIEHVKNICLLNGVDESIILNEVAFGLVRLYYDILTIGANYPETSQENWMIIRQYYHNIYEPYEDKAKEIISSIFSKWIRHIKHIKNLNLDVHISIYKFINDLKNEEYIPIEYLNA